MSARKVKDTSINPYFVAILRCKEKIIPYILTICALLFFPGALSCLKLWIYRSALKAENIKLSKKRPLMH